MDRFFTADVLSRLGEESVDEWPESWSREIELCVVQVADGDDVATLNLADQISEIAQPFNLSVESRLCSVYLVTNGIEVYEASIDLEPFRVELEKVADSSKKLRFVYGETTATCGRMKTDPKPAVIYQGLDQALAALDGMRYGESKAFDFGRNESAK